MVKLTKKAISIIVVIPVTAFFMIIFAIPTVQIPIAVKSASLSKGIFYKIESLMSKNLKEEFISLRKNEFVLQFHGDESNLKALHELISDSSSNVWKIHGDKEGVVNCNNTYCLCTGISNIFINWYCGNETLCFGEGLRLDKVLNKNITYIECKPIEKKIVIKNGTDEGTLEIIKAKYKNTQILVSSEVENDEVILEIEGFK